MTKPKVLITGASGFIGSVCLDKLHRRFDFTRLERRPPREGQLYSFHLQDITRPFKLSENFDVVLHLAALNVTNVNKASLNEYRDVHVAGTRNVIEGVKFKKFIYFSTAKVYRPGEEEITEDSAVEPHGDYALSKHEGEDVCRERVDDKRLLIVRSVNVVGETQPVKALIPVFFQKALNNEPIEIFVPRNTKVQLLHVDDVTAALGRLLEKGNAGVYNLAPAGSMKIGRIAEIIVSLTRSKSEIQYTNNIETPLGMVSAGKFCDEFNWADRQNIQQILERYAAHIKKNG